MREFLRLCIFVDVYARLVGFMRFSMEKRVIWMGNELETKGSMKEFVGLLRQLNWPKGKTALALVLALFSTAASLGIPLVTRQLVDSLTAAAFNWQTAVFLFAVFILQAVLGGVSYYLLAYIGETIVADLRNKLW